MDDELTDVLDGTLEPVTVEELEEVVRRAGQRRRARLVAGAAAFLAVGAVGGAIARGPVGDGPGGFAGGPQQQKPPPGVLVRKPLPAAAGPLTYAPLLRREANGVAVRAYEVSVPEASQPPDPTCRIAPHFVQVELSNAAAVGTGIGPLLPQRVATANLPPNYGLRVAGAGSFGADEGAPATWAVVEMRNGDEAQLRLRVGSATDSMAPVNGKAVLVVPGADGDGVVEALDGNGVVTASQPLKQEPPVDTACAPVGCKLLDADGGAAIPSDKPVTVVPMPPGADPAPGPQSGAITVGTDPKGGPTIVNGVDCAAGPKDGVPPTSAPGTAGPPDVGSTTAPASPGPNHDGLPGSVPTTILPDPGATTTTAVGPSTPPATRAP